MSDERWLFTLGQNHTHRINGKTFDCDAVIRIRGSYGEARARMVELCGDKWAFQYAPDKLDLSYFPGGVHDVE